MRGGRSVLALCGTIAALAAPGASAAQEAPGATTRTPLHYDSPRAATAPVIDGLLTDAAWNAAPWTAPFVDIQGSSRPAPPYRTRAKLLWDEAYLYVAAEMEEPNVWATLGERDDTVYHDADFEVFLDPEGDGRDYFELEINALGTVFDLLLDRPYREGGHAVISWDVPGLRSIVRIDGSLNDPSDEDVGWTVEMAIPWADLVPPGDTATGDPPRPGDTWRVNFSRVEWPLRVVDGAYVRAPGPTPENRHPEDNWVWSPQGAINMHIPERWGFVRFVERVEGEGGS